MRFVPISAVVTAVWAAAAPASAPAQTYPLRPVNVVVPFPPGGSTDWLARMLSQKLEQRLKGATFVVENRPGGANTVAAVAVAKSPPDGHTLLMTTSTTMAINVSVFKNLAYDPAKDFIPVALVSGVPFVLVVNAALPVNSIGDLVKHAKAKPGGLTYASTGAGSAAHLYMVLLQNALGIEATGVPYKGNAPGLQDTIAGHVQVMFSDLLGALPHIRSGKLRVLGVTTRERAPAATDLPTLQEAGVKDYDASAWQMLVAPAKTPKEIVDRLNAELNAIVREPPTMADINGRGHIAIATPPVSELQRFVSDEIVRWAKVVDAAGAKGTQ
ncbi:MAG: tripartite tricarboxylate transporter substrate binding protein [Xanthobacteraceae bacterium]|nr:tripartite tricarboxylate transporter substrate binding protein [Xanthobacteraceae bacterium]